ncbi:E3 ubiquitin-protein ligase SIS3-like [Chenopodium quinoa]|uniref:E3 ubiquitin-protein ligase SIS3-like n=1 Tax=Chenopodium quinoa TaxID=63459 RepID=UPI000B77A325|nr:E3 ubiquitin-protein ligase SIS3-like [Chenopodium quinoa]
MEVHHPILSQSSQQFSRMEVNHEYTSEVVELARITVDILRKLTNWGEYSKYHDLDSKEGDELMNTLAKTKGRLAEVARRRAEASGRDFTTVFDETYFEFMHIEAKIMVKEMLVDPREMAMKDTVVLEEDRGEVCGVCQEEFEVGETVSGTTCMHKFHGSCLWKWLYDRQTCPLCRFIILP